MSNGTIKANFESLLLPIADDITATDKVIVSCLEEASGVSLVSQVSQHILGAGGKRLRPALLLLMARALGYHGKLHHQLAAMIELIHTATLLHDDIIDGSSKRHGKQTAHLLFGNPASILVGDFLYSKVFSVLVQLRNIEAMEIVSRASSALAEGEILQLMQNNDYEISLKNYLQVISRKTASLFEASTELAALIANTGLAQRKICATIGQHIGLAFQLTDDILDYQGTLKNTGKRGGSDFRQGRMTAPLICLLQKAGKEERSSIVKKISSPKHDDLTYILELFDHYQVLFEVSGMADEQAQQATLKMGFLPDSLYKETLIALSQFASRRNS